MDKDKYKSDLDIANEEIQNLSNKLNEQSLKFNQILKENDEYYQNQINKLNQRLRLKIQEDNNELNSSDNFSNNYITNQKLAKNGEEVFNELIKLKKENEQLKIENEKLKQENERLKNNDNYINNNFDDI